MTNRNVTNRVDELEEKQSLLEKSIQIILEKLDKLQEDVSSKINGSPAETGTPPTIGTPANGSHDATETGANNRNSGGFFAVKGRKLEIPTFDGTDPDEWILRAERYFTLNRLTPEERLDVAFISFEGDALHWYQWENKRHPILRWEDLKI